MFVDGPPYPEESFDRILLDAPCSGLGQRPNMSYSWSLKEVCSYQPLQRKLFTTVIQAYSAHLLMLLVQCTFLCFNVFNSDMCLQLSTSKWHYNHRLCKIESDLSFLYDGSNLNSTIKLFTKHNHNKAAWKLVPAMC